MSEYHVEQCHALALSLCRSVVDATGHVVGHSRWQADAERIARALAVLDAMDEHYAGEAAAQAASDDDVRRADQARGEG